MIEQQLTKLVAAQSRLVGLGAVVILNGEIAATAVHGKRKKSSEARLTDKDKWHIGSVTKSFTATLLARLVDQGLLSWETTIGDVYAERDPLNQQWQGVTLEQLLTHTAGAPANFSRAIALKNPPAGAVRMAEREGAALEILRQRPKFNSGQQYLYSNVGYTIAGAMAEKMTGLPWEQLIEREIFTPLKLSSGGFGPPQDNGIELSQPRGHKRWFGLTFAASNEDDNTPIIGPAGTIHLTLQDLATYANEHLQGARGEGTLLTSDTFKRLHTPLLEDYAYGWVTKSPIDLAAGPVLWHNGSNTMWYTLVVLLPELNTAIVVTSNDGNITSADKASWHIVEQIVSSLKNRNN